MEKFLAVERENRLNVRDIGVTKIEAVANNHRHRKDKRGAHVDEVMDPFSIAPDNPLHEKLSDVDNNVGEVDNRSIGAGSRNDDVDTLSESISDTVTDLRETEPADPDSARKATWKAHDYVLEDFFQFGQHLSNSSGLQALKEDLRHWRKEFHGLLDPHESNGNQIDQAESLTRCLAKHMNEKGSERATHRAQ